MARDFGPNPPGYGEGRIQPPADGRAEQNADALSVERVSWRHAARHPSNLDRLAKPMSFFLSSPANVIDLGVNIDHVATLRNARGTQYPDPVRAALQAEEAGADAITL